MPQSRPVIEHCPLRCAGVQPLIDKLFDHLFGDGSDKWVAEPFLQLLGLLLDVLKSAVTDLATLVAALLHLYVTLVEGGGVVLIYPSRGNSGRFCLLLADAGPLDSRNYVRPNTRGAGSARECGFG